MILRTVSSNFLNALAGTRLYPLTDRRLSGLSHAEQLSQLAESGARLVQLREKYLSPLEFYTEAEAAVRAARERNVKIIINDRLDIALALHADGVHLGQDDLPPEAARSALGPSAIIGFSTHSLEQVEVAAQMPIDYIGVGPIFLTLTKESADLPIGLEALRIARQIAGALPLVAIGGITLENSGQVLDAGADAISLVSAIWPPAGRANIQTNGLLQRD